MKKTNEARHDGVHLPYHQTRRNASDKPTIYYIGVDYSDEFSNYGQFVTPNGDLTDDASNEAFKHAGVTKNLDVLKEKARIALYKYGKDMHVFIFKQEYSYGNQTHKNHARPSVIDIWYPHEKYWRYGLQHVNSLHEDDSLNTQRHDGHLNESGTFTALDVRCKTNPDLNGKFNRDDVEDEMAQFGSYQETPDAWISYVLDFLFADFPEWTESLDDAFSSKTVKEMTVALGSNIVKISKE